MMNKSTLIAALLLVVISAFVSCSSWNKKNENHDRNPSASLCEDHTLQPNLLTQTVLNTKWKVQSVPLSFYSTNNATAAAATIIFFHGFADSIQNHSHLIAALSKNGYRVIGFDYPEHGPKGSVSDSSSANSWTMKSIAKVVSFMTEAQNIEDKSVAPLDSSKPVVLMGWSTGGTLALRIAQSSEFLQATGLAKINAVVAITPGIPVSATPFNTVVNDDLTDCAGGLLDPNPTQPWQTGLFSGSLLKESIALKNATAGKIPTLVFTSNPAKDKFVDVVSSVEWVKKNKSQGVFGIQCDGKHGLEFEGDKLGANIRLTAVQFISSVLSGKNFNIAPTGQCKEI
jgi:pimeloyl-ACP methyl ester carboxylesterase